MVDEHLFDDVHFVAAYVKSGYPEMDPCRLQNTLYFLFVLYGAEMAEQQKNNPEYDGSQKYLFPPAFYVYNGGVKVPEVDEQGWDGYKEPGDLFIAVQHMEQYPSVKAYIDSLLSDLDGISIFKLITKATIDDCWQDAYKEDAKRIDPDKAIREYMEKY